MGGRYFIKSNPARRGWTLAELLLILAVIVFLGAIFTCMMDVHSRKAAGMKQADKIRQTGFPYRTWAVDSAVRMPAVGTGRFDGGRVSYFVGAGGSNLALNGTQGGTNR